MAGFLDALKKSVTGYYRGTSGAAVDSMQGIYDLATAPFDSNKDISKAWDDFRRAGSGASGALGDLFEAPGLKQTSEFLNTLQREVVSRPLATVNLAQQESDFDGGSVIPGAPFVPVLGTVSSVKEATHFFDPETWQRAYNNSRQISPGQTAASLAFGMDFEEMMEAKARGDFENDAKLRYTSGTADFAAVVVLDPTIVGGKAAGAARLRYIRPMDSEAIRKGALDNYIDSGRLDRVKNVIHKAESPDDIRLRLLNDNVFGATAANVLFNTRFDDELLNTSIRALYGDKQAFGDLNNYNQALIEGGETAAAGMSAASALGRRAAVVNATARARLGTSLEETTDWNDYVDVLKTNNDLFKQITPFSPEVMRDLNYGGNLLGAPQMRASLTSNVRTAIHQFANTDPTMIVGSSPKSILQRMLVSNRRVHGIDVNDPASDQVLRTYLERANLPTDQRDRLLARYIAAGSGGTGRKSQIIWQAEEAVLRNFGKVHGIDRDDLEKIVAKANEGRGKARYIMSNRQEFASAELQKAYGTKQGDEVIAFTDDDGSYHALVAPVLESQMADVIPLADPGQLNRVFKTHTGSVASRVSKDTSDFIEDKLDGFYRLWKPAVLLRLGWPVRAMSDEGARFVALQGIMPLALSAGRGLRRTPKNMMERGSRAYDAMVRDMNSERIATLRYQRDTAVPVDERYGSLEDAFTDGRLSRSELADFASQAAKTGNVDDLAATMWNRVEEGFDTVDDFGRFLTERALKNAGKDWYTNPIRQADLIKQVEVDGKLTIDPLTGTPRKAAKDAVPLAKPFVARRDADSGWIDNDNIYDYIHANLDQFTTNDGVLSVAQSKDGNFTLQVLGSKSTTSRRWKEAKRALRDFIQEDNRSQFTQARVLDIDGRKVQIEGVMAGAGSYYHNLASSDHHYASYLMDQASLAESRVHVSMGWSNGIDAVNHADAYPDAWQRAALQLANDRVAQKFLGGWTIDDVVDWVDNSDDGRRWQALTRFNGGDVEDRVAKVWTMVDEYIPDKGDLRKKVLNQRHTYADLHEAVKDDGLKPQVHGERLALVLGKHKVTAMARAAVNKTMKGLGSLPNDKLIRYPFMKARYDAHIEDLLKNEYRQLNEGEEVSLYVVSELEATARKRALADLRKWMFNSDNVSAAVQGIRHVTPFGNAWQDAMRAWSGIAFREKPQAFGYLWNASESFENAGLIVDGAGRELRIEDGKEVWYQIDPQNGKRVKYTGDIEEGRYVQFRLPSWASPKMFGENVKVPVRINKKSFNTFLQLNPGAGPVVQVPVNEISKHNPQLGESQLAKLVLPFGPQESTVKQILPTAMREMVEAWNGEDDSKFQAQAMAIWQTEITKYNLGERTTKPTFDEAVSKAKDMKLIRVMSALTLPVAPQYLSPYQPYIDAHRQLMAKDFRTADQHFHNQYGDDYFALTARVTKSAEGLPATMESVKARAKYEAMIEKYPDLAGAIVGDVSGSFSKAAYEYQKATDTGAGAGKKQRSVLSMREAAEDAESRLGWIKFTGLMDVIDAEMVERGISSMRDPDARDLKTLKDAFIEEMKWSDEEKTVRSKWYEEYSSTDRSKAEERLAALKVIAGDYQLIKRDDIQGLADYLIAWDEFSVELANRDTAGGAKTLEAKANRDLAELWQETVFRMKENNLSFAALYNRYLFNFSPEAGDPIDADKNVSWMNATGEIDMTNVEDLRDGFEEEEEEE